MSNLPTTLVAIMVRLHYRQHVRLLRTLMCALLLVSYSTILVHVFFRTKLLRVEWFESILFVHMSDMSNLDKYLCMLHYRLCVKLLSNIVPTGQKNIHRLYVLPSPMTKSFLDIISDMNCKKTWNLMICW